VSIGTAMTEWREYLRVTTSTRPSESDTCTELT